jgi:hypothetical protein
MMAVVLLAWDETPGHYSVYREEEAKVHQSINQCMLTIMLWATCFSFRERGAPPGALPRDKYVILLGDMPLPLLALSRQTGEVLAGALSFLLRLTGVMQVIELFGLQVLAFARDRAGANGRVVKNKEKEHPLTATSPVVFDNGCHQHDLHHCVGEGLCSITRLLPRVVKATGAMDSTGVAERLQKGLEEYLEDDAHIAFFVGQQPDGAAKTYRLGAMKQFLVKRGAGWVSETEWEFFMTLINGDWQRLGIVEHYCVGPRCCLGREDFKRKLRAHLPKMLFYGVMPRISQHRWTGHAL